MLKRSLIVVATTAIAFGSFAKPISSTHGSSAVQGLYKAVAIDNKSTFPGIDGKFKFNDDGTFTFTRKTLKTTLITHGTYTISGDEIMLLPAKKDAEWPSFWTTPATMTISSAGDLQMNGLNYTPSLIGKAFTPGRYTCAKTPAIHYFFDRNGGYKYTGQGMSTGEYWVEKTIDPATSQEKVTLILNILRVDGTRVNFHQRIDIQPDGTFTMEKKFTYHHDAS